MRFILIFICGTLMGISGCSERPSVPAPYRQHGGTTENLAIQVQRGDSVSKIALRYGVPIQKLILKNNLKPPYKLFIGQSLIIPGVGGDKVAPFQITMPALEPKPQPSIKVEKMSSLTPEPLTPDMPLTPDIPPGETPEEKATDSLPFKGTSGALPTTDVTTPVAPMLEDPDMPVPEIPLVVEKAGENKPSKKDKVPVKSQEIIGKVKEVKDKTGQKKADVLEGPVKKLTEEAEETPKTALAFRWPTHGDIIRSYKKGKNDGINISAPEGSDVLAAEEGTVAYAGDQLPGFGNLIMIKHRNGWMTAYAHTKNVRIKRGDKVKKGQAIAQVGQTGSVNSPQLHFEIRKRAQAVDPEPLLE